MEPFWLCLIANPKYSKALRSRASGGNLSIDRMSAPVSLQSSAKTRHSAIEPARTRDHPRGPHPKSCGPVLTRESCPSVVAPSTTVGIGARIVTADPTERVELASEQHHCKCRASDGVPASYMAASAAPDLLDQEETRQHRQKLSISRKSRQGPWAFCSSGPACHSSQMPSRYLLGAAKRMHDYGGIERGRFCATPEE